MLYYACQPRDTLNTNLSIIVWFLRMKDIKQLQVKFNSIAGLVNDLQMQMLSDYERTCKDCDAVLKNNMCYNCDI